MSSREAAPHADWSWSRAHARSNGTGDEHLSTAPVGESRERRGVVGRLERTILFASLAWVVVLAFVRWPALVRAQFNSNSTIDSAFFALGGELVRRGLMPYVGFWDHKPPLIYLIDAVALSLSGGAVWGIWLVVVASLIATLGMAWIAWRSTLGPTAAVVGIVWVAFTITLVWPFNLTEGFVLPVQAAAILLITRWSPQRRSSFAYGTALGVLVAIAFLLRPNLIAAPAVAIAVVGLGLLLSRRPRRAMPLVGGAVFGVALGVAPVIIWLGAHDALAPFWDQVFHYNALYSMASWKARARAGFEGVALTTAYGTLLLPLIGWIVSVRRLTTPRRAISRKPALLFVVVWTVVEIAFASVPGRTYLHYFATLVLPFGYLTAIAACEALGVAVPAMPLRAERQWRRSALLVVVSAIAVVPVGRTVLTLRDAGLTSERGSQVIATTQYVRAHSPDDSRLLVWGHASDVYLFADRMPASRFVYPLALLTPRYADSALVDVFLADLKKAAPSLIVDATPGTSLSDDLVPSLSAWNPLWRYPEDGVAWWTMTPSLKRFFDYVATNYAVVDTIGPQEWVIYARRGGSGRR